MIQAINTVILGAGVTSDTYKVLLAVHLLTAIVGLGTVTLNGVYAAEGQKRPGPAGRAISEANYKVGSIAEWLIVLVPVTGALLVWSSDEFFEWSETWVWLSIAISLLALGIAQAVLTPGHRRINALLLEMESAEEAARPALGGQIAAQGKIQAACGGFLNILLVVLVVLMIWKPGHG